MRRPLPFFSVVILGIGFDLLTKKLAFDALPPLSIHVVWPNVLNFVHAENHGVAFSMFADKLWFILIVTGLAVLFLVWLFFKLRATVNGLIIYALALLLIGATGNLIDRIALGYVRDFIDFVPELPLIGHWAVFNVADICITVGVALYAIAELFFPPKPPEEAKPAAD